ncbi:YdcF family protein [Catenulispora pinisilvae]|uniref:YdcF family protein n=1 Tax=Catenulispora pinisilvae TaxID=2705253 RepID=UPI001890D85C|nr:YdcF family protein [Catenulispora pinisilvae]
MNPRPADLEIASTLWDYLRLEQPVKPADWILVFGGHDLGVARRAAELYHDGVAKRVLVSGGALNVPDGSNATTEAEAIAEVLIDSGIPEHGLAIERLASNTSENFWLSAELLRDLGEDPQAFLVVQKPYAERRTLATARRRWPNKDVRLTSEHVSFADYLAGPIPTQRILSMLAGEVIRLENYAHSGLIEIDEPVPIEHVQAARHLRDAGFDRRAETATPVAVLSLNSRSSM